MDSIVLNKFGLEAGETSEMKLWKKFLECKKNAMKEVRIGLVGKYVELQDAYKSIDESLLIASIYNDRKLNLRLIHSEKLNELNIKSMLADLDGVVIAPGFGQRGVESKLTASLYAGTSPF